MKRKIVLLACVLASACDSVVEPEVDSLTIETGLAQLFPGDTTRFTAIAREVGGDYIVTDQLTWESSDTSVLQVLPTGVALAKRPGTALLRLHLGGATAERAVTIRTGYVLIETGGEATCAFRENRDLYCWGYGRSIGDYIDGTSIVVPRRVPTDLRFTQFSIGSRHMCAVTAEQRAYCWGTGEKGVAGNGNWFVQSRTPLPVAGDIRFVNVSAGWEHSCGLAPEGIAHCWGRNGEGQLGTGDFSSRLVPTPVATDLRFKQLQAAGSNTCGLTLDGDMYCWGHRDYLGSPTYTAHQAQPQRVDVPKLRMFDSANDDPCGITFSDELYCWTNRVDRIAFAGRVADVTVGGGHFCVIKTNGDVGCWGRNSYGELGDGTSEDRADIVAPAGGHRFASIAAGGRHTCGITDAGVALCWGYNGSGRLGNGTTGTSYTPSRVLIGDS